MIPAAFTYHRPRSLEEAIEALKAPDAKILAGGQSLLPLLRLRLAEPASLVDLQDIPGLFGLEVQGENLRIGAMTRHVEILDRAPWEVLREAAAETGDRQVRRLGTIGGTVSHADPSADLPAALLALGATLEIAGTEGRRRLALANFFVGPLMTNLLEGEIVVAIDLPAPGPRSGSSYRKLRQEASGFALVGVAAALAFDADGVCESAGLGVTGVSLAPYRAEAVEKALLGTEVLPQDISRALGEITRGVDVTEDAYAGREYRAEMCAVLGRRAIAAARERALAER